MRVYLNTSGERPPIPLHVMSVAPAAHMEGQGEMPLEWVGPDNKPLTITVEFIHGEANVPDNLGRYLVKHGLAKKTRLILPALV